MGSRAPLSGGSGLISTVKDYWKFAELLRGRGRCPHTGIRLIGPKTYEFMVSNHLPGGQSMHDLTNNPLVRRMTLDGMGMGFGVSVLTDPVAAGVNASEGIIHWGQLPVSLPGHFPAWSSSAIAPRSSSSLPQAVLHRLCSGWTERRICNAYSSRRT